MRDPKTHAKVLAKRRRAVVDERIAAMSSGDERRQRRLAQLYDILAYVQTWEGDRVRWDYDPYGRSPCWHRTEIIPDTDEETEQ